MFIVSSIKRHLHREIAKDHVLHGLVLNLYLNGEHYPHRVKDYFPLAAVENSNLEALMRSHMRDEDKHVALYVKAINILEQPVYEFPLNEVYNEVIRSYTETPFAMGEVDDRDTRTLKLANFMAHLHFLEKRIACSLQYHVDACAHSPSPYVVKLVSAVLKDEGKHVIYTKDAVQCLLPKRVATEVLAKHRRAEGRANLDFSSKQLGRLVREHGSRFGNASRLIYGGYSSLLGKVLFNA